MRDLGHVAHFKKKDVKSVEPISASIPGPSDKPSHEHHPPGIPFLVSKLELARQEMVKRHDDAAAAQAVVQLDLAATLLHAAGLAAAETAALMPESQDLAALARGEVAAPRDYALTMYRNSGYGNRDYVYTSYCHSCLAMVQGNFPLKSAVTETNWRSRSAANESQALISSDLRSGKSDSICASDMPDARYSRTS